jgi:hypothetical protein
VSFWFDPWMRDAPLCQTYPVLFEETVNQKYSVWNVKELGWVIQFRTRLQGFIRAQWYDLTSKLNNFPWNEEKDAAF